MLRTRTHAVGGGTALACLGLAVVDVRAKRAAVRAEARHAQFFSAHGRVVRLLRTFFISLPLLFTVYLLAFWVCLKIGGIVSPVLGLACLAVFAVACFTQSLRYIKAAWTGILH